MIWKQRPKCSGPTDIQDWLEIRGTSFLPQCETMVSDGVCLVGCFISKRYVQAHSLRWQTSPFRIAWAWTSFWSTWMVFFHISPRYRRPLTQWKVHEKTKDSNGWSCENNFKGDAFLKCWELDMAVLRWDFHAVTSPSVDWHTCSFVSAINPTVWCMWLCPGSLWPPNQKLNNYLAQVRFSCIETRSSSPTV